MKLLVVCQHYYPENFQITPICEELVKRGHDVTVLAGLPNYPSGIIPKDYVRGHRDEFINGVHVYRVKELPRKRGKPRELLMNYISFWLNGMRKAGRISNQFDLVFAYQLSPVTMSLPAVKLKKRFKKPLLTYVCDLWPESIKIYIKKESSLFFRMAKMISKKVYSNSDLLICQSPSFIEYLEEVHGIDKQKMCYLPAFSDETYLEQVFEEDNGVVDFVFLGNMGKAQNLTNLLSAFKIVKNLPGLMIHFVGEGSCLEEIKNFVHANQMDNIVRFYGRRPVEEMPFFYKKADVCLVSLSDDSFVGKTLPTKVQGYMAAGKPIFGMIGGSARTIIEEAGCGVCIQPDDVNGFAELIKDCVQHPAKYKVMGEKGRNYFKAHFKKELFIDSLEGLFSKYEKNINL